ncbi:MAG: S-methyl-5'-thioadenosine phosphorylase [SAR202 cluster bacterium]|nr:S-methyl-5'-thioadenosine phosphorylase [SAR202 cluster bacterium]
MAEVKLAFIGGSGLYNMEALTDKEERAIKTPFGEPSDKVVIGTLSGHRVAFIPRHGRGHRYSPSEIPARANIYALKTLGVERLVSISAVGSLKEEVRPLDMLVPDQLIDRTRGFRPSSFFEKGIVAHVGFADPFCPQLRASLHATSEKHVATHNSGTFVVMEGPQFSTRAESELYRSWGASIIGMTALPEAKLAREAEICYATLALVTDYDCWRQGEEVVSVELVVANLMKNVANAQKIVQDLVGALPEKRDCTCGAALENAIITGREHLSKETRTRLSAIIGKYVK